MCFSYCARVLLRSVPSIWLCEECRNCSVITLTPVKTANSQEEAMRASQSLRTKVVDNDQTAPSSTTNHQVVDNKDSTQVTPSSKTPNSMEQVVPVVPRIHDQYTTEESSHEPSFPVSGDVNQSLSLKSYNSCTVSLSMRLEDTELCLILIYQ